MDTMRLAYMLAPVLLLATSLHAENVAQIRYGCAPWDGQTLEITIGAPDIVYNLTIWGKGYEALRQGKKTVHLSASGGFDDDGRSSVCGTRGVGAACHPEALAVSFALIEWSSGGTVAGQIDFKGMMVPFSGAMGTSRGHCG